MDKEVLKKFNDEVFATMPDEPYLGPVPEFRTSRRRTSTVGWCFRAAAVVLAGLFIWALSRPDSVDPLAFTAKSADVYTVANGVRSRVTLPDSSTVWLNCGSELLVADDFEEGNREVSLKRTPAGPTVKVTGTAFNLSCYSPEKEVKVTLLRGSVQILTSENDVFTLEEGSKITVKGGFSSTDDTPDIAGDTAWTKGTLHFDNTSMREVLESIERWYGVDITVRDHSVYRNSFTADFRSESINQVLELLAITCDIVYVVDGNQVTIG